MPITKYTGKDMEMTVGGSTIAGLKSVEINETGEAHDATHQGVTNKEYLPGLYDATVTVNAVDETGQAAFDDFVPNTEVAVVFYPQGNTSGKPKRAFDMIVTGRTRAEDFNDTVPFTATGQVTGGITDTTVTP